MRKILAVLLFCACGVTFADDGKVVAIGFSGGDGSTDTAKSVIIDTINDSHESIIAAIYSFTDKDIARALVAAANRGVKVSVVADQKENEGRGGGEGGDSNSVKYSTVNYLSSNGVDTRVNGDYAIFHNKYLVADGKCVATGSYNWTSSATNRNAENVMLVCDSNAAQVYTKEFNYWYKNATPVNTNGNSKSSFKLF